MAKLSAQLLFCCLVLLSGPAASSEEVDDEMEFNYERDGERGPSRWGDLRSDWRACKTGKMQSPIGVVRKKSEVVSSLGILERCYRPSNASLINRGHDMMLRWEDGAGSLWIDETEYVLKQCHWHTPAEHTVNGKRFALEAHMVHESRRGKVAVVAILHKRGKPNRFLSSISGYLARVAGSHNRNTSAGVIDPTNIKMGRVKRYYRYNGSLTVPPCSENVSWTIIKKVRSVSREQLKLLRVAVHDDSNSNARPLQPLNSRTVKFNQ